MEIVVSQRFVQCLDTSLEVQLTIEQPVLEG